MYWLQVLRICVLSSALICGIVVFSISAHLTAWSLEALGTSFPLTVLGIASGGLTTLTVPVMLIVDFVRTGAFTSMVLVELVWLTILSVLLLATGALVADQTSVSLAACDFLSPALNQVCNEVHAIEAFSFLGWLLFMGYAMSILIVAIVRSSRGTPIWTSSVRQSGSLTPAPGSHSNSRSSAFPHHPNKQQPSPPQYQYGYPQQLQHSPQPSMQQVHPGQSGQPGVPGQTTASYGMPPPPVNTMNGSGPRPQSLMS